MYHLYHTRVVIEEKHCDEQGTPNLGLSSYEPWRDDSEVILLANLLLVSNIGCFNHSLQM
jgi:hypothetical protein